MAGVDKSTPAIENASIFDNFAAGCMHSLRREVRHL